MKSSSPSIWDILPDGVTWPLLEDDPFWGKYSQKCVTPAIHVAILSKLYLNLILENSKTIESRFSVDRRRPYQRIQRGDVLLLKITGGPIIGVSYVSRVWFYELTSEKLNSIKTKFGKQLHISDPQFWDKYEKSSYATLIKLDHVRRIQPIKYSKRDQRAWVTFAPTELKAINS